jgi:chloramphenicol O-acetyltransferase type A
MEILDRDSWSRRRQYDFFESFSQPFFSLSFKLDVTELYDYVKPRGLSFYYALCYATAAAMNRVPEFRYKIRGGAIAVVDELVPSFTDLKPGGDSFYIVTLPMGDAGLDGFCRAAREKSRAQADFIEPRTETDNLIYITCLPWFDMTAFTNERDFDRDDSVPRVAWGKYTERHGRKTLHYSLELNHRLLDGYHVGRFYEELRGFIASLGA